MSPHPGPRLDTAVWKLSLLKGCVRTQSVRRGLRPSGVLIQQANMVVDFIHGSSDETTPRADRYLNRVGYRLKDVAEQHARTHAALIPTLPALVGRIFCCCLMDERSMIWFTLVSWQANGTELSYYKKAANFLINTSAKRHSKDMGDFNQIILHNTNRGADQR